MASYSAMLKTLVSPTSWSLNSWRSKRIQQIPEYPNKTDLAMVITSIEKSPPLVFAGEARQLDGHLYCRVVTVQRVSRSLVLILSGIHSEFSKWGLFSLSEAKCLLSSLQSRDQLLTRHGDGLTLPIYQGDIINDVTFDQKSRVADPSRLLRAYTQSAATLNLLRAFATGGYASLERVAEWNLDFVRYSQQGDQYMEYAQRVYEAIGFAVAAGFTTNQMMSTECWTSHECLLLPYEEALTRVDSTSGRYYNCSAHMLWIGERTRQLDSAHVEFLRGVANPIGIKVSDKLDPTELVRLCEILNPQDKPGRLTLITRMGADTLRTKLPGLIRAIRRAGCIVTWITDPVHGNTVKAPCGLRTRSFDAIRDEVMAFFDAHEQKGTHAGGVHPEMTGQNVSECVGGSQNITFDDLNTCYRTQCDPRLNT
ncbi:phospho-2-dehydro-3-deoxyheptonate aldolase 1 [Carex littledalei]|uniref:Phospho-2-dehydro-3-deoxyheptonate aldolase n=1 Tax=Carex littledalei TaxID=544730 RepID=A0A833RGC3_9POAL|nr:phospho-2-dehydro-3-deoxyheptonate aldolase 1 [Carex littledalei]